MQNLLRLPAFQTGCHVLPYSVAWRQQETLINAGWKKENALRTGFISANTVGGMDKTENFFKQFSKNPTAGKLADVVYHECGVGNRTGC